MDSFSLPPSADSPPSFKNSPIQVFRHQPPQLIWTYSALDALQRVLAHRVREGGPGALILSELAPVITLGRRADDTCFTLPHHRLLEQGVEIYPSDRGGLATYHGPGQWVLFPVYRLEDLTGDSRGVGHLVHGLLEIAHRVGQFYLPHPQKREGLHQGVWSPQGKFASVGVHIQEGVVLHGLAINGFKTEQSFQGIKPCGLDAPVSFLLDQPDEAQFIQLGQRILDVAQEVLFNSPTSNGNICRMRIKI